MGDEEDGVPFLLEIQDVFVPKNLNPGEVLVGGYILRGMVRAGETVEVVGFSPEVKQAIVVKIDHQLYGESGELIGAFCILQGVTEQALFRGQVLASPGTLKPRTTFEADILIDERIEKISQQPFQGIVRYRFHIRDTDISGTVLLPMGKETIVHGDHFTAIIVLNEPLALEVGLRFGIGRFLGPEIITEIIE